MSEYKQFVAEKDKIDFLVEKGFQIQVIIENLNGAFVDFIHPREGTKETLHIETAIGRKYFSSILIKQNEDSYLKSE